ncbi:hypothetical protein ACFL2X_05955 [Candidatus Latescibacterota bacterium]
MKRKRKVGSYAAVMVLIAGLAMNLTAGAQQSQEKTSGSHVRVGIFDSRVIALVYWQGEGMEKTKDFQMKLMPEFKKAKEEGNDSLVKELESKMISFHNIQNGQVFSYQKPVDALEFIGDKLLDVMEKAGVDVIVSKWDKESLEEYGVVGSGWDEDDFLLKNSGKAVDITGSLIPISNRCR